MHDPWDLLKAFCGLGMCRVQGNRIERTVGDTDPLNKVNFERATSRVKKGPLSGFP